MRIMWTTKNPETDALFMERHNIQFVKRIMHLYKGCNTVFITSENVYADIIFNIFNKGGGNPRPYGVRWAITSCNKQYVTEINPIRPGGPSRHYLGCMCKVSRKTAYDFIVDKPGKWYLLDVDTDTRWIAQDRNPNTMLGGFQHIDNKPKPKTELFPKAPKRPWPLEGPTYEQWKQDVKDAMIKTLDAHL